MYKRFALEVLLEEVACTRSTPCCSTTQKSRHSCLGLGGAHIPDTPLIELGSSKE